MISIDKRLSRKIANMGFVCMCLIVALHVNVCPPAGTWQRSVYDLCIAISEAAVPSFFVISGFLMAGHFGEAGWWRREVSKRVKSLAVPFVVWNLFYLVFSATLTSVVSALGGSFGGVRWSEIGIMKVLSALGLIPPFWCQLTFMWYVRCLVVFACCAPLFLFAKSRWKGIAVLLVLFAVYAAFPFLLPEAVDWKVHFLKYAWMKGVCFFSLGAYLRWNGDALGHFVGRIPRWILVLPAGLLLFADKGFQMPIPLRSLFEIFAVMIALWSVVPACPWPRWLTGSAFPIFLLHSAVITGFMAIFSVTGTKAIMESSILSFFAQIVGVILICVGISFLLRRSLPRLSSIAFGGR